MPQALATGIDSLALGLCIATKTSSDRMDQAFALMARASAKVRVNKPAGYSPL